MMRPLALVLLAALALVPGCGKRGSPVPPSAAEPAPEAPPETPPAS